MKLVSSVVAIAVVSACTTTTPTTPTGLTAGGPSAHVPQSYETISSTAATTSTLGGSAVLVEVDGGTGDFIGMSTVATTGSITHDTGRLELNDGTYLFVDANGPDASGNVSDGLGASGVVGSSGFAGTYDYVSLYALGYDLGSSGYFAFGVAGMITNSSDMPVAGNASYVGDATVQLLQIAPPVPTDSVFYSDGVSNVTVDFASGTANVNLGDFTNISNSSGATLTPATAPFDQVQGNGLLISGANFTGGNWVTLSGGVVVNVVGATPVVTSNGTFFGYDPSISAPDEVGGVFAINGATSAIMGIYIAD